MKIQHRSAYWLTLVVLLLFLSPLAMAQKGGTVSGILQDKNKPLEYVTVAVFSAADTGRSINSTLSDSTGKFVFHGLVTGSYTMKCTLVGYAAFVQTFSLTSTQPDADLGSISLSPDALFLQAVTVSAQKKLIEKTSQGFVVNAAANITAAGGTATDLLKNTPTVSVDAEGAITLRGKTPLILINGRNSNLANPDQLPASSIERIEIINNPSAAYDANAESGVINIILKKNKQSGYNGAIALGAGVGSRGRVNSSLLINNKTAHWNIGLGYDNRFAGRTRTIDAGRTNYFLPDEYLIVQHRNDKRLEQLQNLQLNVDFSPNDKNVFSLQATGNLEGQDNNEDLFTKLYRQNNDFNNNTNRHSIEIQRSKVAELALDYHRKYTNERKSLSATISTSLSRDRENTDITSAALDKNDLPNGSPYYQRTHNYESGDLSVAKLDYSLPVTATGQLEAGVKGIYRHINADFQSADFINNDYVVLPSNTNLFIFREQVYAAYLQYDDGIGNGSFQHWKYTLGVRGEQVYNDGHTRDNGSSFSNRYLKLFPSASISYYTQPQAYWKISYAKRINRPGLGQLNPFTDITDSLNPHSGNPSLQPEIIHAMEGGYSREWTHYSFSANAFYRYSLNTIRQISQLLPNAINLTYPVNIGTAATYGLEFVVSAKPVAVYDANVSISLFEQRLNGDNIGTDLVQNAFSWYGKWINNLSVWKGGKLQVTGNYTGALPTPQGKRIAQYFADLGFQQKLGKGNGRIGITITDIFNSFKSGTVNNTTAFYSFRNAKADTRAIIVTFAWSFKSTVKEKMLENKFSRDY